MIYIKVFESPKYFQRKTLNLTKGKKILNHLISTLILMPTKANLITKKENCKWNAVNTKDVDGNDKIFALFEGVFNGLWVWDNWF